MLPSCSQDSWPAADRSTRAKIMGSAHVQPISCPKSELSETDLRDLGNLQYSGGPGSALKNPPLQDEIVAAYFVFVEKLWVP